MSSPFGKRDIPRKHLSLRLLLPFDKSERRDTLPSRRPGGVDIHTRTTS